MSDHPPRAVTLRKEIYDSLDAGWSDIEALCDALERAVPSRLINRSYARQIARSWRAQQERKVMRPGADNFLLNARRHP